MGFQISFYVKKEDIPLYLENQGSLHDAARRAFSEELNRLKKNER